MGVKYVGFDCDECLAQVEQFMPFTVTDAAAQVFELFANKLTVFPFIRPTFWPLLERILEEKERGTVKTFIYSNNGSYPTLKFVGSIVNNTLNTENFFDAIAHYGNSLRTDNTQGQYVKKWDSMKEFINNTFGDNVRPEDVMFFDDLPHKPLSSQLGSNYVRVAPYEHLPSRVDNNELLELWTQSKGDPRFIDVEEVEKTGSLPVNEEKLFLQKFEDFLRRTNGGRQGKKRGRKTRRKYRYRK